MGVSGYPGDQEYKDKGYPQVEMFEVIKNVD